MKRISRRRTGNLRGGNVFLFVFFFFVCFSLVFLCGCYVFVCRVSVFVLKEERFAVFLFLFLCFFGVESFFFVGFSLWLLCFCV